MADYGTMNFDALDDPAQCRPSNTAAHGRRSFMMGRLPISGRFKSERLERIEEPFYPVAALREATVNALCHRTYRNVGRAASLAIYDNRPEIWSDALLPFGFAPDDLKRSHESRPRNPLIAHVFYRRGSIPHCGHGTQNIVELWHGPTARNPSSVSRRARSGCGSLHLTPPSVAASTASTQAGTLKQRTGASTEREHPW